MHITITLTLAYLSGMQLLLMLIVTKEMHIVYNDVINDEVYDKLVVYYLNATPLVWW